MKVVGLLSGGKDSVYNLLHCVIQGHEPVALASLGPPIGKDELDSYMYQTVGHSGLNSIAEALNLPLFLHTISGTAINIEGEYGLRDGTADIKDQKASGTQGDETEDLYELLKKVKESMPEVEAVACGAILSNYQRVRVEHVCSRLNLTPIAFLWERNQEELLHEMVLAGMESVLVKVAGAGLGVKHLGKSLAQMEPTLLRLNKEYQLHVCGEGGEYETFTLDCPLFRKRVVLTKTTQVVTNSDPFSTVAHLHLDQCTLADKPDYPLNETFLELQIRLRKLVTVPSLLDDKAQETLLQVEKVYESDQSQLPIELQEIVKLNLNDIDSSRSSRKLATICRQGNWFAFQGVTAFSSSASDSVGQTLEEEINTCFSNLKALLSIQSASLLSLSHLNLYLSPTSMSLFPKINAIYSTYFGSRPPTRACVAVLSPIGEEHIRLRIGGVGRIDEGEKEVRKSLHVQSISYWAAANIGPYSQGITVASSRLYIAGQIALLPSTLALPSPFNFPLEVTLSLQHVRRVVIAARENRWKGWCEGGICWIADCDGIEWNRRLKTAREGWNVHEEDDMESISPILYVSAAVLPKGASIEWQVTYATAQVPFNPDADDEDDDEDEKVIERKISNSETATQSIITVTSLSEIHTIIGIKGGEVNKISVPGKIYLVNVFHLASIEVESVRKLVQKVLGLTVEESNLCLSFVLVNHIATSRLEGLEVGLQVFSTLE